MSDEINSENSIDSGIEASKSSWSFQSDKVAINFENHVKKSVPFYSEAQDLITTKWNSSYCSHNITNRKY